MPQQRETGIVLSKQSSGEADNICTIYTKHSGKDRFVFRGLKKSTKRPRTASEPGTTLDMVYYTGRGGSFSTVSEFDILTNYSSIRKSSSKIFSLYFILELVDRTTGFSDSNSRVFNLLSAGIETLSNTEFPGHFSLFFAVKYLLMQGIFPDTGRCSWCGNTEPEKLVIENSSLRISCINCTDMKSAAVRSSGRELINKCEKLKLDKIDCITYSNRDVLSALTVIIEYINSYYSIKLKTGPMLLSDIQS
ncbi:MAG: DNA repair protein RecO [Spirochaetae bacterium HGW-Spirochaetae-5]|nr:MAG: DNA repair protein RecO [Spirochaetae bacterium HGW-Spirochaetae-5]